MDMAWIFPCQSLPASSAKDIGAVPARMIFRVKSGGPDKRRCARAFCFAMFSRPEAVLLVLVRAIGRAGACGGGFGAVVPGVRSRFSTSAGGAAVNSVRSPNVTGCRAGQKNNIFEVLRRHAAWVGARCRQLGFPEAGKCWLYQDRASVSGVSDRRTLSAVRPLPPRAGGGVHAPIRSGNDVRAARPDRW